MKACRCLLIPLLALPLLCGGQAIDSLRRIINSHDQTTVCDAYLHLGFEFLLASKFDSSIYYYNRGLNRCSSATEPSLTGSAYNGIATAYFKTGQTDSSLFYYKKALGLYESLKDTSNSIKVESSLALIYKNTGMFEKALELSFNILTRLQQKPPTQELGSALNTIGGVYERMGDFHSALDYYYQALDIRKKIKYEKGIGQSYNNIGEIYSSLNQFDSALVNLFRALEIKRRIDGKNSVASTLHNIGYTLFKLNRTTEARDYLTESLEIKRTLDDHRGEIFTMNALAELNLSLKNYQLANNFLDQAETLILKSGELNELKINLTHRVKLLDKLGRHQEALRYAQELITVKDSLLTIQKAESLQLMEVRYETAQKEQQIASLTVLDSLNKAELGKKQLFIRSLIGGIILLLIIGALIYHNFYLARKHKKRVEILLRELHHRVKNNLQILASLLSLQSKQLTDVNAIEAVKSSESRVNAMALIHRKLYSDENSNLINVKDYIIELVTYLTQSYGYSQKNLRVSFSVDNIDIDPDRLIPIGLIINELVSNAFKYAYVNESNPTLAIEFRIDVEKNIVLLVKDNGKGIDKLPDNSDSFGLKMVRLLTRELRGSFNIVVQNGTTFSLTIPVQINGKH
jgi:two-component sensor histidine kinase